MQHNHAKHVIPRCWKKVNKGNDRTTATAGLTSLITGPLLDGD
jgi:hypothetical protein